MDGSFAWGWLKFILSERIRRGDRILSNVPFHKSLLPVEFFADYGFTPRFALIILFSAVVNPVTYSQRQTIPNVNHTTKMNRISTLFKLYSPYSSTLVTHHLILTAHTIGIFLTLQWNSNQGYPCLLFLLFPLTSF